jgi:ATP-dependent helicase/DNAse subunit B
MPPRLLIAPAGHGKTERLIQIIRQVAAKEPLAPVMVIVPNTIQAAGFRQRLAAAGGALGIEVHTFHTLYAELLNRAGQPIPLLADPLRIRLLRLLVDNLCARGKSSLAEGAGQGKGIHHYAALGDKPGFIAALRNTIEELKRARIFPEDFTAATHGLGSRLDEIALVYSAYQDWLQRQGWADNEGRGWLAAIALEADPGLGMDTRMLAATGFDEFNPTQLAVLSLLAKRAQETLITMTGDLAHPQRPAHHRFGRAQNALIQNLDIQPEEMESASLLAPALAHAEKFLFEKQTSKILENSEVSVEFIEAQTRAIEARAALRWLKARIVRDGMGLVDVAVLARDIEPYRSFLEETAVEFGIPLRILGGLPLNDNPAIVALLSLLSLPAEGQAWPRRALLDAWRSPYFDWSELGITPTDAVVLDELSRTGRVTASLEQWHESFEVWRKNKSALDEDGELFRTLDYVEGVEKKFEAFVDLLTPPNEATARQYIAFIENLMGDDPALFSSPFGRGTGGAGIGVVACARLNPATAERDVAALCAFKDVLRGLALAESTFQTGSLDYDKFYMDLRGAVEGATYTVTSRTGILAASVLDGRGLAFQAVALLGLSEGEFPRQEREDILLRESDRTVLRERCLPLESRLRGDEGSLFYQAITRARQRLLLTRPYLAEDGQSWEASAFWMEMRRLNGDRLPVQVRPEDKLDPAEAASQVEWMQTAGPPDVHIQSGIEVLRSRLNRRAAGPFEGDASTLADILTGRFGADHGWSASRLESYGTCPFEFFVAHALGLEPRTPPEDGYDVRMLGSMLHKILEDVYSAASDLETCLALLPEKARRVFENAPAEYGFRPTPLWQMQQQEMERRLRETITALAEVSQGYTPLHQEARFGMGTPSLVVRTEAGEVRLHGYIDRLDIAADGSLRVIDYKSGSTPISAKHLQEGSRLQLPIYALAAQQALQLGNVSSGFYWHIQSAEASSLKLEKYEGGMQAAFAITIAHIGKHVNGIRAGHFEPKSPAEGCPMYCPAAGFCWKYKEGY